MLRDESWGAILARRDLLAIEDVRAEVARRRREHHRLLILLDEAERILDATENAFVDHDSFGGPGVSKAGAEAVLDELLAELWTGEIEMRHA